MASQTELRSDELFNGKVAVSHIGQEYTFQDDNDAAVKLVHGVLANALVSGNSRPMMPGSFHWKPSAPVFSASLSCGCGKGWFQAVIREG